MTGRLHSPNRCSRCRIHYLLCFCDHIPTLELSTQVMIIMHKNEEHLPSNTATLARECLKNSEIRMRGLQNAPLNLHDLDQGDYHNLVIFPSEDAIPLESIDLKTMTKPIRLIVPDGSWNQAKSTVKREPLLQSIPKITIPMTGPSVYRLRKEPTEDSVSTFEAIARSLGVIHGADLQQELEKIFTIKVERNLWAKNIMHENECTYPIPEAAIKHRQHPQPHSRGEKV